MITAKTETAHGRITGEQYKSIRIEFEGESYTLSLPTAQYGSDASPDRKDRAERMLTELVGLLSRTTKMQTHIKNQIYSEWFKCHVQFRSEEAQQEAMNRRLAEFEAD